MQVTRCSEDKCADSYPMTWEQVRYIEGVYQQTGNTEGRVIVLCTDNGSKTEWCAIWHCGSTLRAYGQPGSDIKFRRAKERVCIGTAPL